jgi:copper chaperone CopZ
MTESNVKRREAGDTISDVDLGVPSMVCDGCAERIRTALMALPGIRDVKVSLWRKRVCIRYEADRLREAQIRETIAACGFTSQDTKAGA